jgi:hypothetical protein
MVWSLLKEVSALVGSRAGAERVPRSFSVSMTPSRRDEGISKSKIGSQYHVRRDSGTQGSRGQQERI